MEQTFFNEKKILDNLFQRYPILDNCRQQICVAFELLKEMYENSHMLYVAGNGGSASDSEHIVGELMKSFMYKRPIDSQLSNTLKTLYGEKGDMLCEELEGGLPAIALPSLTALSTAIQNDVDGKMTYAQMIQSLGKTGDVFMGISTSGNSSNVVTAMMVAKAKHLRGIGLTGENKCLLDELCEVVIHVPETETYKIQELHLPVYHALCAMLESHFFSYKVD